MTKYFYDCEFIEDGKTIDLISIGIVSDDGRELYLQNLDCDFSRSNDWLKKNVLSKLNGFSASDDLINISFENKYWHTKQEIAQKVQEFITGDRADNELWAYYSAYDHVALCQLFGKMIDLPDSVPMFTNDLMQLINNSNDILPKNSNSHNALDDANWVKHSYDILTKVKTGNK